MYKSIYVPVDNSDHSNRAVACSIALGKAFTESGVQYCVPVDPTTTQCTPIDPLVRQTVHIHR